jgi:hypothetical protein
LNAVETVVAAVNAIRQAIYRSASELNMHHVVGLNPYVQLDKNNHLLSDYAAVFTQGNRPLVTAQC